MNKSIAHMSNRRTRRCGSILIYMALGIFAFIGAASLAIDMGNLYARRAKAQQAADAAALAGAYQLAGYTASPTNPGPAINAARQYANLNGYDYTSSGVAVNTIYPIAGEPNNFTAQVQRQEPLFFARIFGLPVRPVSASATAQFSTEAPLSVSSDGKYGVAGGPTTLSVFGPDARYDFGDYRSVKKLGTGADNPDYDGKGYNFTVNVPSTPTFDPTVVEIFDPDCHNADNQRYVLQNVRIDELRQPAPLPETGQGGPADATTTKYTLYWDPTGSGNPAGFQKIDEKSYGDDATTDMKWVPAFTFNRSSYPTGSFVLNVTSVSGSSENGFLLRAGPVAANFDPANGTSITADGHVPMNFVAAGNAPFNLGTVPEQMAGKTLTIRKFDTDIGSVSVEYSYKTGGTIVPLSTGVLAGNGKFTTDTITLPDNFPGGDLLVDYKAGANDTSVWEMQFAGGIPGKPGNIRLVR